MLKLAGALCVLLGAGLYVGAALGERRRCRTALADLVRSLRRLGEEVRLARTPLPALLTALSADCGPDAGAFFRDGADRLRRGEELSAAWRTAADLLPLPDGDLRTVSALGPDLRGDGERVRDAVNAAAARLDQRCAEMDRTRGAEVRQTAALSFSAAALAVILLY